MRKALTVGGLIAAGAVLGAALVQLGRSLERDGALPPAAAAVAVALPSQPQASAAPSEPQEAEPSPAARAAPIAATAAHDDPPALVARAQTGYTNAKRVVLEQPAHKLDELLLLGYVAASDHTARCSTTWPQRERRWRTSRPFDCSTRPLRHRGCGARTIAGC